MLNRIDLRESDLNARELAEALPRATLDVAAALDAVAPTIADVRERGAAALREAAERFDHVRPVHLRVPREALTRALEGLDPAVREALELSIAHNRAGHAAQLPRETVTEIVPGGTLTQRWIPVRRVGLYVPGGLAVYPSSVVMNVVAAQVAGVEQVALASPPQAAFDGLPHPTILAACELLGVEEVYAVGGAQAIAMFAYGAACENATDEADVVAAGGAPGTALCERVDVVTGPGNIFVAAAKRAVRGVVGIDAEAGPTEIAIVADGEADPELVAADLLSQAEHDPNAGSVLITDSERLGRPGGGGPGRRSRSQRWSAAWQPLSTPSARGRRWRDVSRGSCWCGTSTRRSRWLTPTPPSTWRSTPATPRRWRAGSATRERSSSVLTPRCRWATTWPAPTTCCPPAARHASPRA